MIQDTCAALTGVFPLVLLTVLFEGRVVKSRYRKKGYIAIVACGAGLSLVGLVYSLIGVQSDGLSVGSGWVLTGIGAVAILALTLMTLLVLLTFDDEDGNAQSSLGKKIGALAQK
jgi:hypothetical protein